MKIKNPVTGTSKFIPREYQQELIDNILSGKNVILYSARQMGVSTTLFYCIRELCLRNSNYKAILVTSSGYASEGLNRFPDNEFVKSRTKSKIEYVNGSVIEMIPGKRTFGENLDDYEVFFDLYEFINPRVINNLKHCYTDNKIKTRFYSFTGNNDFIEDKFIILKWNFTLNDNWDNFWYKTQIDLLGEKQFEREFIIK